LIAFVELAPLLLIDEVPHHEIRQVDAVIEIANKIDIAKQTTCNDESGVPIEGER